MRHVVNVVCLVGLGACGSGPPPALPSEPAGARAFAAARALGAPVALPSVAPYVDAPYLQEINHTWNEVEPGFGPLVGVVLPPAGLIGLDTPTQVTPRGLVRHDGDQLVVLAIPEADSDLISAGASDEAVVLAGPSTLYRVTPDLALEASSPYILSNAGDAYLFPSLGHLEEDVLRFVGRLVGDPDAPGFLVSGGSEANLMALHAARKAAGDGRCELVAARSAHFSIRKAADLLGMQLVTIPLDVDFRLDLSALKASIGPDTAAVVATAGTAELGCIDDVEGIAELCREEGVHLHVDAAFGGFVIPFLRELGVSTTRFGFDVPGVSSVTIDPHKMGLAPVPCGCVLFANEGLAESLRVATPYVDGGASSTVLGTRPGWSMAGAWATIRLHGRSGYREIVRQCISKTSRIAKGVHRMEGARLVVEPSMNVMGIECLEPDAVLGRLRELGWRVTLAESPRCLRVVVMPHIADEDVDMFLGDLRTALD